MNKHLHIVCLTVPYPVNYGGVYDLFYKLPALQQQGINIHLHCFDHGQGKQPALEQYCATVHYYNRTGGLTAISARLPYIVNTRRNHDLLNNLLKDDAPILMEGIHCTYLLNDERFAKRKTIVRLHNVEYLYYQSLFSSNGNLFNKLYYAAESRLLKKYEAQIARHDCTFLTVSPGDSNVYCDVLGARDVAYLPLFLPDDWQVHAMPVMGAYCLYHGDLGIAMNERAAIWLIKLFAGMNIPLVIAGKNPPGRLCRLARRSKVKLTANPTYEAMQEIIAGAHINILPSFSTTGIKIKLLNALFNGRHCLVNTPTVHGTGLDDLCHVVDTDEALKQRIEALYHQPFTPQENQYRQAVLSQTFNNSENAKKLVEYIWE